MISTETYLSSSAMKAIITLSCLWVLLKWTAETCRYHAFVWCCILNNKLVKFSNTIAERTSFPGIIKNWPRPTRRLNPLIAEVFEETWKYVLIETIEVNIRLSSTYRASDVRNHVLRNRDIDIGLGSKEFYQYKHMRESFKCFVWQLINW